MKSRKQFALEFKREGTRKRILQPAGTKYDPDIHFQWYEESDYLATALNGVPYATYSTDMPEALQSLIANGYDDGNGVIWDAFFAYWKDQEGRAYMAPRSADIRDLRDVGVITDMKDPADFLKVAKYANRLFSPTSKELPTIDDPTGKIRVPGLAVWGKEVSWNENEGMSIVLIDQEDREDLDEESRSLSVRYVDLKTLTDDQRALVDGLLVVGEKAAKVLGLSAEPTLGMAWRGTFGTEHGLGKGHILYIDGMNVDIVTYGPKTILKTDKFFFGSMGELHVGVPHTDMQAYVNFHYHRPGLAVEIARLFMREIIDRSKNEAELRELLLRHVGGDESQVEFEAKVEAWILRRALMYGVSFLRFPGLYRRVIRYLMERVMACDEKARIPMESVSYSVAKYGYALADYSAIDSEGDIHPEKAIPEGTIVFPDLKPGTKVVCYRQPSEDTNAWVPLTVTYRPGYKRFAGRGICLLGRGAKDVLKRLGGGDMDDSFVIVHDPKWVEAFHTMRPYPETEKITADTDTVDAAQESETLQSFTDELLFDIQSRDTSHYTNRHVSWQIELAKNARAGIGPVVNFGMLDMLMSDPDHRISMLADLKDNPEFWEWLDAYKPYQAAKFMTNLELVIDGNVKDRALLAKLGDVSGTIKRFHKDCKVYPACMSPRRIPKSKRDAGGYVTARSFTCRSLDDIKRLRTVLQEYFVQRQWLMVAPADKELRNSFPFEKELHIRVRGAYRVGDPDLGEPRYVPLDTDKPSLMTIWGQEWKAVMSIPDNPELLSGAANKRIVKLIADEVAGEDADTMKRLAVEVYFNTYTKYATQPRIDETTGELRTFPDGLLWSPVFANYFIDALREAFNSDNTARLAGFYRVAELRPEFLGRLLGTSVGVRVRNHQVYILDRDDEFTIWVGWVSGKAPNGYFRMDSGVIEFRKGQPIVQPIEDFVQIAQKPITRLYPSVKRAEALKLPAVKPSRVLAQWLFKALETLGVKKEDKK